MQKTIHDSPKAAALLGAVLIKRGQEDNDSEALRAGKSLLSEAKQALPKSQGQAMKQAAKAMGPSDQG